MIKKKIFGDAIKAILEKFQKYILSFRISKKKKTHKKRLREDYYIIAIVNLKSLLERLPKEMF